MNTNPLHFDEHYASQTQHGRCLVNGTLVFAVAVGMTVTDMSLNAIANLEYESVKHVGPTFHGDTLYSESTVLAKTESTSKPDRGIVYVETRCRNQRSEVVLTLRRRILIAKRPFSVARSSGARSAHATASATWSAAASDAPRPRRATSSGVTARRNSGDTGASAGRAGRRSSSTSGSSGGRTSSTSTRGTASSRS
jgi:acyl dehydratase